MKTEFTGTAVVRNRMPGGVRGRREQSRLLLDPVIWSALYPLILDRVTPAFNAGAIGALELVGRVTWLGSRQVAYKRTLILSA